MAIKPIIEIALDDSAFERFYAKFEAYKSEVEHMPESWKVLSEAIGDSGKELSAGALSAKDAFALAAAQASVISEALSEATRSQKALGIATHTSAKGMQGLAKASSAVGMAIEAAGGWALKLASLMGIGGVLGGFGLGELASEAFTRFRSAGRLGISPGALASFQVNAQQFLGTSALESAANAQIDISKAGYLAMLGIGWQSAQGMAPGYLAFRELKQARAAYLSAKRQGMAPMQMPGVMAYLSLGGNIGDIRNAAQQPLSQLNRVNALTDKDQRILQMSQSTAQAWTKMKITLDRAGMSIQTALINGLVSLGPEIGQLATQFSKFLQAFLSTPQFAADLRDVVKGLEGFISWLNSPQAKNLGTYIINLAGTIDKVLQWFMAPSSTMKNIEKVYGAVAGVVDWPMHQETRLFHAIMSGEAGRDIRHTLGFVSGAAGTAANAMKAASVNAITSVANKYGVDPLLALATAMVEDPSLNPAVRVMDHYANGAPAGYSTGLFQLNEHGEGAGMSIAQLTNSATNAGVALRRIAAMEKRYPNLSPGVIAALAQRPAHQGTYAAEINRIYRLLQAEVMQLEKTRHIHAAAHHLEVRRRPVRARAKPPVHVSITNSTASRVAVSLNAVAAG